MLIHNKLNKENVSRWFYYTDILSSTIRRKQKNLSVERSNMRMKISVLIQNSKQTVDGVFDLA
jgi:hypothetical protein